MRYFLLFFLCFSLSGQGWQFEALAPMPEARANNAVCTAIVGAIDYVYSFAGIDTSKIYSGISGRNFRYNPIFDFWEEIEPLPDGDHWIAMGASTINNQIYVVGGYDVFASGNEVSCNRIYQFNPNSNTFVNNDITLPVPIDDHVQCVYKDSLLFIVTGWSNNTNVTDVQIYDPANQEWLVGTPLPDMDDYAAFGASGTIIGDTLYYIGGARIGPNFPITQVLRKGYINPNDPSDITWTATEEPYALGYRQACTNWNGQAVWFGGSSETYNYDGLSYESNTPVSATNRQVFYSPANGQMDVNFGLIPRVMDLRGIAKMSDNEFIICGGMMNEQVVSDRTYRIFYDDFVSLNKLEPPQQNFAYYNNGWLTIIDDVQGVELININGMMIYKGEANLIEVKSLPSGIYILRAQNFNGTVSVQKINW